MAWEREAEALAAADAVARQGRLQRLLAGIRKQIYVRRVKAYEACFLGEDGELTRDGQLVIQHLMDVARMGKPDQHLSDAELREAAGARKVVLAMIEFLREDPRKLRQLARLAREQRNND